MKTSIKRICICTLLLFAGVSLSADTGYKAAANGSVKYQYAGEYDIATLNKITTTELAEFSSFKISYPPAKNSVKLYKIIYDTVVPEKSNKPVSVSGLIAIPEVSAKSLPVVSYQHGTVFSKTQVPSSPEESMETRLMIAQFAGQGYIVIAADYIGKGMSSEPDSYMTKESSAQACLDMLRASEIVCAELGLSMKELFLSGWSQGSYVTMVFLNRLEKIGIPVKAATFACAPNDLFLCMNKWINVTSKLDVAWVVETVALLIKSYENYYRLPGLSTIAIKPQYLQAVDELYKGKLTDEQISKQLPVTVKELLTEDFAAAGSIVGNRFFEQLQQNMPYSWRYKTQTRYYYGLIDEVIPPYIATLAVGYQTVMAGAKSEAVFAGDTANHRGTFLFGISNQKNWFDGLIAGDKAK